MGKALIEMLFYFVFGAICVVIAFMLFFGGLKVAFGDTIEYSGPEGTGTVYIKEMNDTGVIRGKIIIQDHPDSEFEPVEEWQSKHEGQSYDEYMMDKYGDNPELGNVLEALEE